MQSRQLLAGVFLDQHPQVLHVHSVAPLAVLSSAVVGAELAQARHLLNVAVPSNYASDNPADLLTQAAEALGVAEPFVGLLTAARLDRVQVVTETQDDLAVVAVLTLGIRYPTAAGITPAVAWRPAPGTINLLLLIDGRLSPAARVNAALTATEAKTLALVEAGVIAPHGGPASGTGTDAVVVAGTERGGYHAYAGPIALVGALVGRAVRQATLAGIAEWRAGEV